MLCRSNDHIIFNFHLPILRSYEGGVLLIWRAGTPGTVTILRKMQQIESHFGRTNALWSTHIWKEKCAECLGVQYSLKWRSNQKYQPLFQARVSQEEKLLPPVGHFYTSDLEDQPPETAYLVDYYQLIKAMGKFRTHLPFISPM